MFVCVCVCVVCVRVCVWGGARPCLLAVNVFCGIQVITDSVISCTKRVTPSTITPLNSFVFSCLFILQTSTLLKYVKFQLSSYIGS